MKRAIVIAVLAGLVIVPAVLAQSQPGGVSQSLQVYVFPANSQSADQQGKDETACTNWAVQNTKTDPNQIEKQRQQEIAQAQQAGQGSAARGAVRGAARGALIGEIANDKGGEGAAVGAVVGGVRGQGSKKQAQQQAAAEADARAAQRMDTFRKAFAACMEGKKYTVKF